MSASFKRRLAKVRCRFAALLCVVMLLASLLPGYAVAYDADTHTRSCVCTDANGNQYTVQVRYDTGAQIPGDAVLRVDEIGEDDENYENYLRHTEAVLCDENTPLGPARFLDIRLVSMSDSRVEYQPAEGATVEVRVKLDSKPQGDMSVVHFAESAPPEVLDNTVSGDTLRFETTGFSIYAIVDAPSVGERYGTIETNIDVLDGYGFYLAAASNSGKLYWMQDTIVSSGQGPVIKRTNANDTTGAVLYYFQAVPNADGKFYLYMMDDQGGLHYVKLTKDTAAEFVNSTNNATAFSIEACEDYANRFFLMFEQDGTTYFLNERKDDSGKGFSGSTWGKSPNASPGSGIYLYESLTSKDDPYNLDGLTSGIVFKKAGDSLNVYEMTAQANNASTLSTIAQPIDTNPLDHTGTLVVTDEDLTQWTFHSISDDKYTVTTRVNGVTKYLSLTNDGVSLVDQPSANTEFIVQIGDGTHQGYFSLKSANGNRYVGLSQTPSVVSKLTSNSSATSNAWFKLTEPSILTENDFVNYVATKVSIAQNANKVHNGDKVVIYRRIWNDAAKRYDFYALNHDGSLVYVYDEGDTIRWEGTQVNPLLWEFTEYYYNWWWYPRQTPNGYYELRNVYSGKYIAPQMSGGQILSNRKIGINLTGRTRNNVASTIIAWDDRYYDYAALKTEGGHVIPVSMADGEEFYFAVMNPQSSNLTPVNTVNNDDYGIKLKMVDFPREYEVIAGNKHRNTMQTNVLGSDTYKSLEYPTWGLVSTELNENGYPVATATGTSLEALFGNAVDANHLFVQEVYNESGYFEYKSTQNFATYDQNSGNFTLYQELGTVETTMPSQGHGQFMPYNTLDTSLISSYTNVKDVNNKQLPLGHPRRDEQLYSIPKNDANYFFGMQMEATFVQTPDGKDDWGHDIIFEFAGDDDMWLYVDGQLVLDLGGIHSAMVGKINFATGEVTYKRPTQQIDNNGNPVYDEQGNPVIIGKEETIYMREIFKENYLATHPNADLEEVAEYLGGIFEGNTSVFKNYTAHTMKMFYMERGASASNLEMRFNLSTTSSGQLLLNKQVSGTDKGEYAGSKYAYQIYYYDPNYDPNSESNEPVVGGESGEPSGGESGEPSGGESGEPSGGESGEPSGGENGEPSGGESGEPSGGESGEPSGGENGEPSGGESGEPSGGESGEPSGGESGEPVVGEGSGEGSGESTPSGGWRRVGRHLVEGTTIYQYDGVSSVNYEGTETPVDYAATYEIDGITYNDVFFLVPGETADIRFPSDDMEYYIVECGIDSQIYDHVYVNTTELTGQQVDVTNYYDYATVPEVIGRRKVVNYDNHVKEEALRTLTISKRLLDESGNELTAEDDPTGFRFRMYLGNENSFDDLDYYRLDSYYVKTPEPVEPGDPPSCYCRYDSTLPGFVSLGKSDFEDLTDAEKRQATFTTSPSGAIDMIPAGYQVELRNLILGTKFKVIEQESDWPKGYELVDYDRLSGSTVNSAAGETDNQGTIYANEDPHVQVTNCRGWGLTINKVWSDESYMYSHDNIYTAVYYNNQLVTTPMNTVRRMHTEIDLEHSAPETSVYYFFKTLPLGGTFSDYKLREVVLTETATGNPWVPPESSVDDHGYVTYDPAVVTVTPVPENGTLTDGGIPAANHEQYVTYNYTAHYDEGTAMGAASNIRTDTVTNSRPGLRIVKTDWLGNPLEGAEFRLQYPETVDGRTVMQNVGAESYWSDDHGLVTVAYLEENKAYTLTETLAPEGYQALIDGITITLNGNQVVIGNDTQSAVTVDYNDPEGTTVKVKNKDMRLQVLKVDMEENGTGGHDPLAGAHFALYPMVIGYNNQPRKDYYPVPNYEDLVSGPDGVIPHLTESLLPGTYFLTETQAPEGYMQRQVDVVFTLDHCGNITIVSGIDTTKWFDVDTQTAGLTSYTILVPNHRLSQLMIVKKDSENHNLTLAGAHFELYAENDFNVVNDAPESWGQPIKSTDANGTDTDGLFVLGNLQNGTYYLVETQAPLGYFQLEHSVKIEVGDHVDVTQDGVTTTFYFGEGGECLLTVTNVAGHAIPATGGIGTHLFYFGGTLLLLAAGAALLWLRRRRSGVSDPR